MLIYNDTIELSFGEANHRYSVSKRVGDLWTPPEAVVGTTTITGIINKPALVLWPLREAITYLNANKGKKIDKLLLDEAYNAHKAKSDKGKAAGTIGHALIEALLLGKEYKMPTDPERLKETESVMEAFTAWQADYAPEPIYTEQQFYSLTHQFAGTCDLVANINGKLTVIDYKTTNPSYYNPDGIYAENFAQMGAYIIGLEEMLGIEVEEAAIVNLPKDGKEYKMKTLSDMGMGIEDAKMYFLYCLGLYKVHKDFSWKLGG